MTTNNVANYATGASATVLTGNGVGTAPTFQAAATPSGGWSLLQSATPSSAATADFAAVFSSSYDMYVVEFFKLLPATDGDKLWIELGTGAGPTWITANYQYIVNNNYNNTSSDCFGSSSDSKVVIDAANGATVGVSSTAANGGVNGQLIIIGTNGASNIAEGVWMTGAIGNASAQHRCQGTFYQPAGTFTSLRVLFSTGNIASGTIRVYGIKNS